MQTPDIPALEAAVTAAEAAHTEASTRLARYEEQLAGLRAEVAGARTNQALLGAWKDELARHGREPTVPKAAARPEAGPAMPTDEEIAFSERIEREEKEADGARKERVRQRAAVQARFEQAVKEAARARVEAARCEALLVACRSAPTEIARETVARLGDMGRVTVRIIAEPGHGKPCCQVLYDGRPYSHVTMSTGERLEADFLFRGGMRRAGKIKAFPIALDCAQDHSEQIPATTGPTAQVAQDGPVYRLVTAATPLTVT